MFPKKELQIYGLYNYMDQQQRINPWSQLAILIGLCSVGMLASALIANLMAKFYLHVPLESLSETLLKPEYVQANRLFQLVSTFFVMAFPSFALAIIMQRSPTKELGFNKCFSATQLILVIFIAAAAILVGGSLGSLNKMIPMPENATAFFNDLEKEYDKNIEAIANMKNGMEFFVSLIMLAFFPAMFEEMFFRGAFQPIMQRITKNNVAAIIITAFLFSILHLSFYGFLTRLFLGIILGYIFHVSKNLWFPIIMHFVNNAFALSLLFIQSSKDAITKKPIDEDLPIYYGIPAIILVVVLFTYYNKESKKVLQHCEA